MTNCGHCHTCGAELRSVLDGEEWCPRCAAYRRYDSHGWSGEDRSPCPPLKVLELLNTTASQLYREGKLNIPPDFFLKAVILEGFEDGRDAKEYLQTMQETGNVYYTALGQEINSIVLAWAVS